MHICLLMYMFGQLPPGIQWAHFILITWYPFVRLGLGLPPSSYCQPPARSRCALASHPASHLRGALSLRLLFARGSFSRGGSSACPRHVHATVAGCSSRDSSSRASAPTRERACLSLLPRVTPRAARQFGSASARASRCSHECPHEARLSPTRAYVSHTRPTAPRLSASVLGVCPRCYHRDDCIALYPWHIMSPLNIH
jgi:hypothetical protein